MWQFCRTILKEKRNKAYTYSTESKKESCKYKKRSILHFLFYSRCWFFSSLFLEKRYTVASYQSHITCRYITTWSEFTPVSGSENYQSKLSQSILKHAAFWDIFVFNNTVFSKPREHYTTLKWLARFIQD